MMRFDMNACFKPASLFALLACLFGGCVMHSYHMTYLDASHLPPQPALPDPLVMRDGRGW